MKAIQDFCEDVFDLLKKENELINTKMTTGENAEFNSNEWRGLGMFSTTEPIIKWLIYRNLVDKYKMWSEDNWGYKGTKRLLDLALILDEAAGALTQDEYFRPDTAIELKWAGINKDGNFNVFSRNSIEKDIVKLADSTIKNKYFMQFMIADRERISKGAIEDISLYFDKRSIKVSDKPVFHKFFPTDAGTEEKKSYDFHIIVWKVGKRNEIF